MKQGIFVAGSILVDNIASILAYPKKGELTKILSSDKAVGGLVPNVGIDLKRLDKNLKVYAGGKISDDENGRFVLDTFKKEKIDISKIKVVKEDNTSFTNVVSEIKGERTFYTYAGTSSTFGYDDIDFKSLDVKMIHLGYFLLLDKIDNGDGIKILKKCNELGIKTSIDLVSENSDRYSLVKPVLKYVDYLIINEIEASALAGIKFNGNNIYDIMKKIKSLGVKEKIIVHQVKASYLLDDNEFIEMPSLKINPKDIKGTTGAGDAFCAGSLLGIYNNYSNKEILDFASKVAAISLTEKDATSGVKSKEEIFKKYKNARRLKSC